MRFEWGGVMASEFILDEKTANYEIVKAGEAIDEILKSGGRAKVVVSKVNNGTIPMLRTWRMWMGILAPWMVRNGATMPLVITSNGEQYGSRHFTPDDCHELFSYKYLPVSNNGNRRSWVVKSDTNKGRTAASIGEKLRAMEQMQAWAVERGINLYAEHDSEFMKEKGKTEV